MINFLQHVYEVGSGWEETLNREDLRLKISELEAFLENEYKNKTIFPQKKDLFRALELCPLEKVKVVILGQDPYHGDGQAHGLSFSVPKQIKTPPSLRNILKLIFKENTNKKYISNDLTSWAKQGVLLLNSVLTVEKGQANSHSNNGWEEVTDSIIKKISNQQKKVFILWGSQAQKKIDIIDQSNNLIIRGVHPSPLSAYRGFFDRDYFWEANQFLKLNKIDLINWKSIYV